MKISDLFSGSKTDIDLRIKPALKSENFTALDLDELQITYTSERYWLIDVKNNRIEINGVGPHDNANLDLVSSQHSIIQIFEMKENKLTLKIKLFNEKITLPDVIEIGFGDIILDDIDKRYSRQLINNDKVQWLKDQLFIERDKGMFVLINNSPKEGGFRIFGKNININVVKNNNKFEIKTIIKTRANLKPSSILFADIVIKDISSTADIKKEVSLELSKLNDNEKYLHTWKKYQDKEKELTQKKLRNIGFLKLDKIEQIGEEKYKINYIEDNNYMNWVTNVSKNDFIELVYEKEFENSAKVKNTKVKLLDKKEKTLIVKTGDNLIERSKKKAYKYAMWSISGDNTIQSRRDEAIALLGTTNSPMPQLSAILEGISTRSRQVRKIPPLTPKVKREFGDVGPNEMQEEALRVALNTPDVVIIQGPPGTGKTKVITALAKRLAEDAKDNNLSFEKEVLLTAFQHDAVENMASRTSVLGLPAMKFGKKNSQLDVVDSWIKNTTEYLESQQHTIDPNDDESTYDDLKKNYIMYIESLDQYEAKRFLSNFSKDYMSELSTEVLNEIFLVTTDNSSKISEETQEIEKFIRNIRVEAISFEDDGLFNLKRFIKRYSLYVSEKVIPELEYESFEFMKELLTSEFPNTEQLKKLEEIKLNYLDRLVSGTNVDNINLPSQAIENIYEKLIDIFSKKIKRSGSIYTVLSEYQNDLQANKENVNKAIESYTALLASTIQGSKANVLTQRKPDPFDTIIVDEAARANPLDLIIPMTSAKRRIVLVGDHRQLPHMVDDSIQEDLADNKEISKEYVSHLKDSLFERLFIKLQELEKKDGIRRVVTLDTQYRMHPEIGDFISRTFYEREGDPKIKSGTPAENLIHGIKKYENKVAVSINVPNARGKEEKYKGSTYRPVEAREAIKTAKEIMEKNRTLSVGVITFYSQQVNELNLQALDLGLVEKDEENNFKVLKEYEKTKDLEERFRIGSVDAFQGKEFDVVILSLVRSNNKMNVRGKYGFLTSCNRLNVAMSRAKKLLIAVGDEEMFKDKLAEESVFGLFAFYKELIGSDHGISL